MEITAATESAPTLRDKEPRIIIVGWVAMGLPDRVKNGSPREGAVFAAWGK